MDKPMSKRGLLAREDEVAQLLVRAMWEPDEAEAARLIDESGAAFVEHVRQRWGANLRAAKALVAQAERALDQAESASEPAERRRQMRLFNVLMQRATRTQCVR
jgi:hypothetical protein